MSPLRFVATMSISAVATFLVFQGTGCGTKAVGIADCREIEEARCEAAAHCGEQIPVDDVEACKRFYRDQCLHGLVTEKDPSSSAVRACVTAIAQAGECAAESGPDTPIRRCAEPPDVVVGKIETACDVIERPQFTAACFFLNGSDEEPPHGEGGAPNNPFGGATAGTEAAGGSAGGEGSQAGTLSGD